MTVLITGGAGFIGAQLAREFLRRGERVVVFDKAVHDRLFEGEKNVSLVRGDITSAHEVLNVVRDHKVHTIFHLARSTTRRI